MKFNEYIIKRKKGLREILISILLYIAATFLSIFLALTLLPIGLSQIAALLFVGCYYFAYKISSGMNKEFEYIFTGDNLHIDVIMNANRRKRLISCKISEIEIVAPEGHEKLKAHLDDSFDKKITAISKSKFATVYNAVIVGEKRTLIKFEPPHAMIKEMYSHIPSKIVKGD